MDHATHNFHHTHQFNQAHMHAHQQHHQWTQDAFRTAHDAEEAMRAAHEATRVNPKVKKAKDFAIGIATIATVGYGIYRLFK